MLGIMAAEAMKPDEAEAARPRYMTELVDALRRLESAVKGENVPEMDFGTFEGKRLRQIQAVNPKFTKGPLKLSGKNIAKFAEKRIANDQLTPEQLVDGLNSVFHGTRSKVFPDKKDGAVMFSQDGEHVWRGVAAPHEDFSGMVTGYRYPVGDMKKELRKSSDGRPFPSYPSTQEGTLPGRFTTVEESEPVKETISSASGFRKGKIPAIAGASTPLWWPGEAEGGETPEARARRLGVVFEPGLEAPYLDPVGMAVAPVGVAGAGAKVLAAMAEPAIAYGMDRLGGMIGRIWRGE